MTMVMERPPELGILPGMSGNAYLVSQNSGATKIPDSALFEENGKTYVWRVDDQGVVAKADITMNDNGQILQGLADGDQIIISGINVIEPGIKVRAWVKERGCSMKGIITLTAIFAALTLAGCGEKGQKEPSNPPK